MDGRRLRGIECTVQALGDGDGTGSLRALDRQEMSGDTDYIAGVSGMILLPETEVHGMLGNIPARRANFRV